jgi:hypothetical protein
MKTAIAYILTIFGLPVAIAAVIPLILSFPFFPILKKKNSKILWVIFQFMTEMVAGIAMIWLSTILWSWLNVTPSILLPILLAVPVTIWNGGRIRKYSGTDSFLEELAQGIGALSGIVVGAIFLL